MGVASKSLLKYLTITLIAGSVLLGCQTVRPAGETSSVTAALEFQNNCESDPDFKKILLMATKAKSCREAMALLERIQDGSADFDEKFKALVTGIAGKM